LFEKVRLKSKASLAILTSINIPSVLPGSHAEEEHLASLTSYRFTSRISLAPADPRIKDAPRYRPVISAMVLLAADCLAIAVAVWCQTHVTREIGSLPLGGDRPISPGLALLSAAVIANLAIQGRYGERITFWSELRLVVCGTLFAIGIEAILGLLAGDLTTRGPTFAGLVIFTAAATVFNRIAKYGLCRSGAWRLPIVVLGNGPSAAEAEAALTSDPLLGYRFVGRVDPDTVLSAPGTSRLWPVLERYGAARLLIALDGEGGKQRQVIECALREQVPFAMVPQLDTFPAFAFETTRFFGQNPTLLSYRNGLSRPAARIIKATIDVTVAALMLALSSFLFLILAVASRLDGGPMLYAHRRVGAGGRPFYCLKFRTMVVDADRVLAEALAKDPALAAEWAASRKLVHDPRVTPLGRVLRKTSLDELPQLINVLRLEMSLVGPRPIVEDEVPLYGEAIAQYYATRPGLTGLWQVSGRSNTSYTKRVQLDVWYVNNWTIWNDIAVLFKTIPVVLGRQGAH
jgi:Undecaprenyl-phosphate galactose phosphotransferase WbaP